MSAHGARSWTPRRFRLVAWMVLTLFVFVRVSVLSLDLDWRTELLVVDGLTYLMPMAIVIGLLLRLTFHTRGLSEHALWSMLAPATALLFSSELYWTWYALAVDPHGPPPGTPVYVLHLVALSMFLLVSLQMTDMGRSPLLQRVRLYLDLLGLSCVVFPAVYLLWTQPVFESLPGVPDSVAVVYAVYPIAGVLLILGTLTIFVGWKLHRWRRWEQLTAASIGIYALGLIAGPWWYPAFIRSNDFGASWFTGVLGLGYGLLGVACVYRMTAPASEAIRDPWPLPVRLARSNMHLHPVVMAVSLPVLGWMALANPDPAVSRTLTVVTALLTFSLVGRELISDYVRTRDLEPEPGEGAALSAAGAHFEEAVDRAVSLAAESGQPLALVVFSVVDSARYDSVLMRSERDATVGRVIQSIMQSDEPSCELFRMSMTQLAVICAGSPPTDAATFARRVWLHSRRGADTSEPAPELFAGVAGYPEHADNGTSLLLSARAACEQATASDHEPVAIYDDGMGGRDDGPGDGARMRILRSTIRSLAQAVDARNPYTRDHSSNVSELATAFAQVLDLPEAQAHRVSLAALIHDVGKVGLRDELLSEERELSPEEALEVEEHVVLGEMILEPANIPDVLPAVRHHHEHWDGTGYPDGLAGYDIPIEARILAICDVFEALSSDRPGRSGLDSEAALEAIEQDSGTLFDPVLVSVFGRLIRGLRAPGVAAAEHHG